MRLIVTVAQTHCRRSHLRVVRGLSRLVQSLLEAEEEEEEEEEGFTWNRTRARREEEYWSYLTHHLSLFSTSARRLVTQLFLHVTVRKTKASAWRLSLLSENPRVKTLKAFLDSHHS